MKQNKPYIIGIIFYLIPVLLFIIYYINFIFFRVYEMQFWYVFLISLFPTTIIGLIFFVIGLFKKKKTKNEKTIGVIGLIYGIVVIIFLFIALNLLLIVLKSF